MIQTLLAFSGRCHHAVASFVLFLLLSPAALQAQTGNIVPGTAERDSVVMRTTFYFSPGNGEWIERSDYPKSGRLVRWAQANPDARIVITGWADASGTAVLNDTLSLRRARTVRRYLVRKGIAAERITYEGAGVDVRAESDDKARRADVCAVVLFAAEPETAEPETGQTASPVPAKEITPPKQQPTRTTPEKETRQPEKQAAEESAMQPTQQQQQTERAQQAATPPVQEPTLPVAAIPAKEVSPAVPPTNATPTDTPSPGRYIGVKTNLAAWAGTIMNVAADVEVGRHWSVELPVLWCPWYVSSEHAIKTLIRKYSRLFPREYSRLNRNIPYVKSI